MRRGSNEGERKLWLHKATEYYKKWNQKLIYNVFGTNACAMQTIDDKNIKYYVSVVTKIPLNVVTLFVVQICTYGSFTVAQTSCI